MLEFLEELESLEAEVSQEAALLIDAQSDMFSAMQMVKEHNAIDRENAMAILRNVPSCESINPNEFTLFPTTTKMSVAIEGFWEGIASGLEKLVGLMFSLIFGVLKLLVKPIEWLVGGGKGDGANATAIDTLDKLEKSDKPEKIEDADRAVLDETVDEVIDKKKLNEFEFKSIANANVDMYKDINDYIRRLYTVMWKSTRRFIEAHGKIEGGDAFYRLHKDLDAISVDAGKEIAAIAGDFLKDQANVLDLGSVSYANLTEATDAFERLTTRVRELESREVDPKLVKQHYRNKVNKLRSYINQLHSDMNFDKSDRELLKETDNYTSQFNTLQDKLEQMESRDKADSSLTSDDINAVRDTVNNQLTLIRAANAFVKNMFMVSIKGKRGFFKGIKITDELTEAAFAKIRRMTGKAK